MAINGILSGILFFALHFLFSSMSPERLAIESNILNTETGTVTLGVGLCLIGVALYGELTRKENPLFNTVSFVGPVLLCIGLAILTTVK